MDVLGTGVSTQRDSSVRPQLEVPDTRQAPAGLVNVPAGVPLRRLLSRTMRDRISHRFQAGPDELAELAWVRKP